MSKKSSRTVVIAGNWKMYKTIEEAVQFVETLTPQLMKSQGSISIYLAVPFTAIFATAQRIQELNAPIVVGAQNMNDASEGAFTGEIAAHMLKEAGAQFVILGHSERRHQFHESDAFINAKVKRAFIDSIQPLLCIGETMEQRKAKKTEDVLREQLLESLKDLSSAQVENMLLAYEPVWAIGTGEVAKPEDAQAAHLFCRTVLAEQWGKKSAARVPILYGGSVKPENASDLLEQEEIDGLLVGGASLSPEVFSQIIYAYSGIDS